VVKCYHPSLASRFLTLSVGLPGAVLFVWAGVKGVSQAPVFVACALIALGIVLAIKILFDLTLCVEIDAHSITRSWLFGRRVVPINEIHRLSWGGSRGVLVLIIHYGAKRTIQIPSSSIAKGELRALHDGVLTALGLEGIPLRPRFAEYVGYVDIDEMLKMKGLT